MMKPHAHDEASYKTLEELYKGPSLYDRVVQLLGIANLGIPDTLLDRDFSQPYVSNDAVKEAWRTIYTNTDQYWNLYELAEKLVDLEDWFLQWRFRHMKTVERIIGFKRGTGGTSGVSYLKKALDIRFFPELWELRSELLSLNHFGGRPPFFHGQSVCTQGFWNPGAVLNNLMTEAFAQIGQP